MKFINRYLVGVIMMDAGIVILTAAPTAWRSFFISLIAILLLNFGVLLIVDYLIDDKNQRKEKV